MTSLSSTKSKFLSESYSPTATEQDVFNCFRLLLRRNPNPEEWPGHSMLAGQPLAQVVRSYLTSLEFSLLNQGEHKAQDNVQIAQYNGFSIYCDLNDPAIGRHVHAQRYEADVAEVFKAHLKPGMAVIDIGANIGYFTMLSGALVGPTGYVLAAEPNSENAKLLECSRRLNEFRHVEVAQVAAGSTLELLALYKSHSTGTTLSVEDGLGAMLAAETVPGIPITRLVPSGRRTDLIKVDVDGAEYHALVGCQDIILRDKPMIISEFSPGSLPGISGLDGKGYLTWLHGFGYEVSVINPDGSLENMGLDCMCVLEAYSKRGTDHIDIVAAMPAST